MEAQARGSQLTPRQEQILLAVVKEYVETAEAVASKTVQEKYGLGVSRATIRNEMAHLEALGYLRKPHTSGGRIPQQAAYRLCVDRLGQVSHELSQAHAWVCLELSRAAPDLPTLLQTSVRLLVELTGQPALAGEPMATSRPCPGFRLAPISARAVRISCPTPDGGVRELLWEPPLPLREEQIRRLGAALGNLLQQTAPAEVPVAQVAVEAELGPEVVQSLINLLVESSDQRVYINGATRLMDLPDFRTPARLRELMAALAEEGLGRALLCSAMRTDRLTVLIGSELGRPGIADCSLVAQSYRAVQTRLGALGVLGPLRMPYWRAMGAVHCVAREVGSRLSDLQEQT